MLHPQSNSKNLYNTSKMCKINNLQTIVPAENSYLNVYTRQLPDPSILYIELRPIFSLQILFFAHRDIINAPAYALVKGCLSLWEND